MHAFRFKMKLGISHQLYRPARFRFRCATLATASAYRAHSAPKRMRSHERALRDSTPPITPHCTPPSRQASMSRATLSSPSIKVRMVSWTSDHRTLGDSELLSVTAIMARDRRRATGAVDPAVQRGACHPPSTQPEPGPARAGQSLIDVDALCRDSEALKSVALQGQVLCSTGDRRA